MYAGIAAGSKSAHSKNPDKKNSYLVINHAVVKPNNKEKEPTPVNKIIVLSTSSYFSPDKLKKSRRPLTDTV